MLASSPPRFLSALALISPDSFPSLATDEILSPIWAISLVPRVNGLRPLFRGEKRRFAVMTFCFPSPACTKQTMLGGQKRGRRAHSLSLSSMNCRVDEKREGLSLRVRPCCHTCCSSYILGSHVYCAPLSSCRSEKSLASLGNFFTVYARFP